MSKQFVRISKCSLVNLIVVVDIQRISFSNPQKDYF